MGCPPERQDQGALHAKRCFKRLERDSLPIRRCPGNATTSPISVTAPQLHKAPIKANANQSPNFMGLSPSKRFLESVFNVLGELDW